MSLGLSAPAAVSVEVRASDERRVFRLSREIGQGGVRLERPAPFEPGEPVDVRFTLPGGDVVHTVPAVVNQAGDALEEEGERGGCLLMFREPPPEIVSAVVSYIADRLGLPPLR